jgi:hypothetical protein
LRPPFWPIARQGGRLERRVEWVVAIFRDVTERFQKDKALRLRLKELEGKAG